MVNLDEKVESFVTKRTLELYNLKSSLAVLRRGVGKKIGDIPDILEYIMLPGDSEGKQIEQAESWKKGLMQEMFV